MINIYKRIAICFLLLLTVLGLIEKDAFIKKREVLWKPSAPVSWNDFRGYPNYLSGFSAAINSSFVYRIIVGLADSVEVRTVMHSSHSWVKCSERKSLYVLRHEQYHFNLSEVEARKFRQALSELPSTSRTKKNIRHLYRNYLNELGQMQNLYDSETKHSVLLERQKDWEYMIDSMLNRYELNSRTIVKFSPQKKDVPEYFRLIDTDPSYRLYGKFPLDSLHAKFTRYYRFFYEEGHIVKIEFHDKDRLFPDNYFKVPVIKIRYDSGSYNLFFFDANNIKTKDLSGAFGYSIVYSGKKLMKITLNALGQPSPDKYGIVRKVWDLDYKKRKVKGRFFDQFNNQVRDEDGNYIIRYRYDQNDNLIESANYSSLNHLEKRYNGVAVYRYSFDKMKNLIECRSFDDENLLCGGDNDIAISKYCYDLNGNVISECYFKADGCPFIDKNGAFISYSRYDDFANRLEERCYGVNKNLIIDEDGMGKILRKFDLEGNLTEFTNFGAYDDYLNTKDDFCRIKFIYNDKGLIVSEKLYYADSLKNLEFKSISNYQYDDQKNIVRKWYSDSTGIPLSDSVGITTMNFSHDKRNNLTGIRYYNEDNKLQPDAFGAAIIRYEYDANNYNTEIAYFDENDHPVEGENVIFRESYAYDNRNNIVERKFFNSKNVLTKNEDGLKVVRAKYDDRNNKTEVRYFDEYEGLTENNEGVAIFKHFYDVHNNDTTVECYNKLSHLVQKGNNGIAIVRYEYSRTHQLTRLSYFDHNNRLIDSPEGFAIKKNIYDHSDRLIKQEYYSKFNQLVVTSYGYASIDFMYDNNENVIAEIYRDENQRLIERENGYAICNWIHDRNGKVKESYGYGADEKNIEKIKPGPFLSSAGPYYNYSGFDKTWHLTNYYKNGQKQNEVWYVDGKLEGVYRSWYENGELESEISYRNGMRNGKTIEYYRNGQKSRELDYSINHYVYGSEVSWYENGILRSKYVNGELTEWDQDGSLIKN